ncbi:MAG: DUF63 family protein [Halobacteriota archaeon]
MLEAIRQFVNAYYIHPITHDTGYNPVNTVTWALLLVLCLFLTLKLLDKLGITIDKPFIAAVSPYVFVGASLRVMEELINSDFTIMDDIFLTSAKIEIESLYYIIT